MSDSLIEKSQNQNTVAKIERLVEDLNQSSVADAYILTVLKSIDELTQCFIGLKKDFAEIDKRLTVLETKDKILSGISSKIGLVFLGAAFSALGGVLVYFLTRHLQH